MLCQSEALKQNNHKYYIIYINMFFLKKFYKQADALDVKAYVPTVAIVKDVNKICFFNGDTSKEYIFDQDGDFIKVGEKETRVVCTYNVTSTTEATQLLYSGITLSEIASMEVDGINATVATVYTFTTTGKHTVKYTFKDNTAIPQNTFNGGSPFKGGYYNLTSVVIPDSVTSIGENAFYNCTGLNSLTIGSGVTSIGNSAFTYCKNLTSVTIPDSVITIGDYAFYNCTGLNSLTIGSGVTSIGNYAFYNCSNLYSVVIPDRLTSIGNSAFDMCSSLNSLTIGSGVTSIGAQAFNKCTGLTSIVIPNSVTSIGNYAFYNCTGLNSLTIGSSVITIGENAFDSCSSLTSIAIPNSVTSIGGFAFLSCSSLTSVVIPDSVTLIGYYAFNKVPWYESYRANTVNQHGNIVYINNVAYQAISTDITSCEFKEGTVSIGGAAFQSCSSLTSVTIPDSVASIGAQAFNKCTGLTTITYTGTLDQWKKITRYSNWHSSVPSTTTVNCTDGTCGLDDK